jgi:hypothetical protein
MRSLTEYELLHGIAEPPPETREIRAGPLIGILDGIDLRYLRFGRLELVRRIYVAVRDQNWNTIPAQYRITHLEQGPSTFVIEIEAEHREGDLKFAWRGSIAGSASGQITYLMDGVALSDFPYNRIGLCILHPMECAGWLYRAKSATETITGSLPTLIAPQRFEGGNLQPLFPPFKQLSLYKDEIEVRFDFEGDLFEMEDQRNWTDASFKTYSTPLALGFPHQARANQRIVQRVTITVRGHLQEKKADLPRIVIGQSTGRLLPTIGFCLPGNGAPSSSLELHRLHQLLPDHLRIDIHLNGEFARDLEHAIETCRTLGCALEVAIFMDEDSAQMLNQLASFLEGRVPVARFLIFNKWARSSQPTETTSAQLIQLARRHLQASAPGAAFVSGTDMYFCELNRSRPPLADAIVYSINPQVHASDEISMVETLQGQAETVKSARSFCDDRPIIVSPITLKPRSNPHAVVEESSQSASGLPRSVDVRQMSLFGAVWTVGSVKYLAESGASSLTYYETVGWRGLMERESGPPLPDLFPSAPNMAFPLYHVFADLAEWKKGDIVICQSNQPLTVIALAIESGSALHLLVANLTSTQQRITIGPLQDQNVSTRRLDTSTALNAMFKPDRFRAERESMVVRRGELNLNLAPYAVIRIDVCG